MGNEKDLSALFDDYASNKEIDMSGRYINYECIQPLLQKWSSTFEIKEIGKSVLGIPLNAIYLGNGKTKILAWSQMHGNETTTTKAVFDFFKISATKPEDPVIKTILKNCRICILPMLNPDGAQGYTRSNANNIDLNRDAFNKSQPESRALNSVFEDFQPDFCFNLHDQRTIFSAGNKKSPATVSFLSPAVDEARNITPSRQESMQLITAVAAELRKYIPGQIGRYDDVYNINCTGDTFQSQNVPTVLFEAGHFPENYDREETRKLMFLALMTGFYVISTNSLKHYNWNDYFSIPENKKLFNDVVLRNCLINGEKREISFQFKEVLRNNSIVFVPVIEKTATELPVFGHREIDCRNLEVTLPDGKLINENVIVEKILLNKEYLSLNWE